MAPISRSIVVRDFWTFQLSITHSHSTVPTNGQLVSTRRPTIPGVSSKNCQRNEAEICTSRSSTRFRYITNGLTVFVETDLADTSITDRRIQPRSTRYGDRSRTRSHKTARPFCSTLGGHCHMPVLVESRCLAGSPRIVSCRRSVLRRRCRLSTPRVSEILRGGIIACRRVYQMSSIASSNDNQHE